MAAEWRYTRSEINITHETKVPNLPTQPKTEPNDAAYHNHQLECDERVDALYKELSDFSLEWKQKQRDMYDEQNGKGIMWREMKELFDEQKIYLAQKREIMSMRETADMEIQDLVREMQKLAKQCHPIYNTLEDLEKGKKILSRRLETTSMTGQQEKALIKEITQIDNSRPIIVQRLKLQKKVDELRQKQRKDSEQLPQIKKVLDTINQKIKSVKGQQTAVEDIKAKYQQQLD